MLESHHSFTSAARGKESKAEVKALELGAKELKRNQYVHAAYLHRRATRSYAHTQKGRLMENKQKPGEQWEKAGASPREVA